MIAIIAQYRYIVNKNAIVPLTVYQKYYGVKLMYHINQRRVMPCFEHCSIISSGQIED